MLQEEHAPGRYLQQGTNRRSIADRECRIRNGWRKTYDCAAFDGFYEDDHSIN
jgi:hypothetical protein